jgi:hypothetical protein
MDAEVLKTVGQVAGIGSLALGVFLLLFRDIVRKNIFPKLPAAEAYRLLRLINGTVWSVAVVGITAWVYVETRVPAVGASPNVTAPGGVAAGRDAIGNTINIGPKRLPGDPTTSP